MLKIASEDIEPMGAGISILGFQLLRVSRCCQAAENREHAGAMRTSGDTMSRESDAAAKQAPDREPGRSHVNIGEVMSRISDRTLLGRLVNYPKNKSNCHTEWCMAVSGA